MTGFSGVARDGATLEDALAVVAFADAEGAAAVATGATGMGAADAGPLALVIAFGAAGEALAGEVARPMKASAKSPQAKNATRTIGFHQVV